MSHRSAIAALTALLLLPLSVRGQTPSRQTTAYWRAFAAGFASSILVHEGAHIATSLALGARPHFGFSDGRPTIYSGIDAQLEPHKQFEFSSAGLIAQSVLDEGVLDVPHDRGSAFERGILAGGIGTALFYATIGRTGSVSDLVYMSTTSRLSKNDLSLLLGAVAVMHVVRIEHDGHYANFFLHPAPTGGLRVGVWTQ